MIESLVNVVRDRFGDWQPEYILEAGCNNGEQTLELVRQYPNSTILAFEPVPWLADICRRKFQCHSNIRFFELALTDVEGKVKFHQSNTNNSGIGSLYKPSGLYPLENMDTVEIEVQGARLDAVLKQQGIPRIDLMWLDCQGGEVGLLKGLDWRIEDSSVIYTEYIKQPMYTNQPLYQELTDYLTKHNFIKTWEREQVAGWFGDVTFINKFKL